MRRLHLEESINVSQIMRFQIYSITHKTFVVKKEVLAESLLLSFFSARF